jgi:hypothetical protein
MECSYRRAQGGPQANPGRRLQISEGFLTETHRDAASIVLPDGRGAILFRHPGSCPSLPLVQEKFALNPAYASGASWPAYFFPDRYDPKAVWILRDRRPGQDAVSGRLLLKQYLFVTVKEPETVSIAQNVPIAWQWYQRMSAQYRGGRMSQRKEDRWSAIIACVLYEDEWRERPEFVRAARGQTTASTVNITQPERSRTVGCPGRRTPKISLVPSDDYSKAILDLDRNDLRWAAITTPYVQEYRDGSTGAWTPELCIARESCTGIHIRTPDWLYLPSSRVFVRLDEERLETYHFPFFAVRHGDGL